MRRIVRNVFTFAFVLSLWLIPNPARGEPILVAITGGFAEFTVSESSFNITGTEGFSIVGQSLDGTWPTRQCCYAPGSSASLFVASSGGDLPATATLRGRTFTELGSASGDSAAVFFASGTIVTPSTLTDSVVLRAPFDATIAGSLGENEVGIFQFTAQGGGMATAFLRSDGDLWDVTRVRFDFGGTSVVPEPGTMLLLGMGIAGAYRATRKRRHLTRSS